MPKTTEQLLEQARGLINHPCATSAERLTALQVAYDLGVADGKLEGSKRAWTAAAEALKVPA